MPVAALPKYLAGQDLSTASPGMRFGMYLKLWGVNRRSQALLWTTHDIAYEIRGQDRQEREVKYDNKVSAIGHARALGANDKNTAVALLARQRTCFAGICARDQASCFDALATAPFTTGLGNEHPLENGFAFLNPYGLPYLPGSGVKGVLRQAARELAGLSANAQWDVPTEWSAEAIDALFGKEARDGTDHQRGALCFWDVIPQIEGDSLMVEIMTPHQNHYYQNGASPHESGQPTPISFLTVPPGSAFVFHVHCNHAHLKRLAPELAAEGRWRSLLEAAFAHAFTWLGFGAKTSVGYGAMEPDPRLAQARAQREAAEREAAAQREEEARRAALSPEERAWEEHKPVIDAFRQQFERASKTPYKPGSLFDSQRQDFLRLALAWEDMRSRGEAGDLLARTMSKAWGIPGNKDNRQRIAQAVLDLRGPAG